MSANRYGNILTIILVVLIVAILIGIAFLTYNYIINPRNKENKNIAAIEEFDKYIEEQENEEDEKINNEEQKLEVESTEQPKDQTTSSSEGRKKKYHEGFVMLGYITIPKTNVKQPILDTVTPESLNTAVAVLYPSNAQLNQPGNIVIIGHNYKNGQFFSNNKKLSVGDKLKIKDNTGTELTYTIYEKFETTEQDTSFYNRNTNGAIEVTLSTCTDDAKARTIILARVE
ncbi:MAG: sortase [Clostridia bacterium]|nr:sortase [Clostridia bacterium]